jgi:hypothetical protein
MLDGLSDRVIGREFARVAQLDLHPLLAGQVSHRNSTECNHD